MVLKNELENLANYLTCEKQRQGMDPKEVKPVFGKVVSESCCRAREAWAVAAFSNSADAALRRYFGFHFTFLNGILSEKSWSGYPDAADALHELMDHLLTFYGRFVDQAQWIAPDYITYRIGLLKPLYLQFNQQLSLLNTDEDLILFLKESLGPLFQMPALGTMTLGSLFYRERLMTELFGKSCCPELMTGESLITTLMAFNFNHALFFGYLRKRCLKGIHHLRFREQVGYFAELIAAVPVMEEGSSYCFDSKWPHISVMYRDWLNDYRALLNLSSPLAGDGISLFKLPLNISVKQLACMIRAFYQSGFYGAVSLTAIFDHAAAVFSTKRQEHISAESLSNAYYALDASASLKVVRMLGKAIDFLKPYCFPA